MNRRKQGVYVISRWVECRSATKILVTSLVFQVFDGLTVDEVGVLSSIFRFLPFGAGSRDVTGDLVIVMVRLMTCFTQTGSLPVPVADLGDSHHFRFASTADQSAGESADRSALLLGESVAGDQRGD